MSPTILLVVLVLSLLASVLVALWIVRTGRNRALARLAEVPGPVRRTTAATSLGLASLGKGHVQGTGTLVLTDGEVAFAQWRPDRLVRIPRADITEVDTARSHLEKKMNADVLRIRWVSGEAAGDDTIALYIRDLDPWLEDLGGTRSEPDAGA